MRNELPRRQFFAECGIDLGKVALASLMTGALDPAVNKAVAAVRATHPAL